MPRFACAALLVLVVAGAPAQAPRTAAQVTEPGRTLARPLDMWLGGAGGEPVERTLLLVVDVDRGLAAAGFADAFDAALAANRAALAKSQLGLAIVGAGGGLAVAPTADHAAVARELRQRLGKPSDAHHNLFACLRELAPVLARGGGERRALLVALANGDLEDQVEKTAELLARSKVRVDVLASEASLADTFWAEHEGEAKQAGGLLVGGDAAWIDLPWNFALQRFTANALTPSGHASWALSHLAAATQGRVFLYAGGAAGSHECQPYYACLFCTGDHQPRDDGWSATLVAQYAPLVLGREQVGRELAADPAFVAVLEAWNEAAKAGLVRVGPSLELQGSSVRAGRRRPGRDLRLFADYASTSAVRNAEQAAKAAAQLRDKLTARLDALGEQGAPRSRVIGRYFAVLLQLTRVNLISYAGWCEEAAARKAQDGLLPPERPVLDPDDRPAGVSYSSMGLCHGVRPYFEVELPGGDLLREELQRLDAMYTGFMHRHGRSPFGTALRVANIAYFQPAYMGVEKGPTPKRRRGSVDDDKPTTPVRPERRGTGSGAGGGSGGTGGPTTGGGG